MQSFVRPCRHITHTSKKDKRKGDASRAHKKQGKEPLPAPRVAVGLLLYKFESEERSVERRERASEFLGTAAGDGPSWGRFEI